MNTLMHDHYSMDHFRDSSGFVYLCFSDVSDDLTVRNCRLLDITGETMVRYENSRKCGYYSNRVNWSELPSILDEITFPISAPNFEGP